MIYDDGEYYWLGWLITLIDNSWSDRCKRDSSGNCIDNQG